MRTARLMAIFSLLFALNAGVAHAAGDTPLVSAPLFASPASTFICRIVSLNSDPIAARVNLRNSQGTILASELVALEDGDAFDLSTPGSSLVAYCDIQELSASEGNNVRASLIVRGADGSTTATVPVARNDAATTRVATPGLTSGADSTLVCLVTNAGTETQDVVVRIVNDAARGTIVEARQTVNPLFATGATNVASSLDGHCEVFAANGTAGKNLRVTQFVWSAANGFGDARSAVTGK